MNREEQTILKARIKTLEMYLDAVFVFLKDTIDFTVGRERSTRTMGLMDVKRQVEKKLREFRKDLEYQDRKQIELEK